MFTKEGHQALAKMFLQGDNTIVPAGGNFYIGVCSQTPDYNDTLASITTEPTTAGGYARQPITRDAVGFPTLDVINGEVRMASITLTFSAVGADFSTSFDRIFLTDASSGTTGTLFCYSGAYATPIQLLNGQSKSLVFEFYP